MKHLILLGLMATGPALAGGEVEEVLEVNDDVSVRIENTAGEVQINVWDRNELRVLGDLGDDVTELRVTGSATQVSIEVVLESRWGRSNTDDTDLVIQLPRKASIDVETVSADVIAMGLEGRRFVIETVSGDVEASVQSSSVEIGTVSGDLELVGEADSATLSTVSGDLSIGGLSGDITAESVSGDVEITGGVIKRGRFEAVSGDLELVASLAEGGSITAESMSGSMTLVFPNELSARLEADTFSGDLRSDIGQVVRARYGPQKRLETTVGGGDGRIRLSSHSGDIRIRQQ